MTRTRKGIGYLKVRQLIRWPPAVSFQLIFQGKAKLKIMPLWVYTKPCAHSVTSLLRIFILYIFKETLALQQPLSSETSSSAMEHATKFNFSYPASEKVVFSISKPLYQVARWHYLFLHQTCNFCAFLRHCHAWQILLQRQTPGSPPLQSTAPTKGLEGYLRTLSPSLWKRWQLKQS